jgi:diguanylate cyclase (GGDEF)-like protein
MRILIVDDSDSMRGLLAAMVTAIGHEPIVAASGAEGLALFKVGPPDLVLLDVVMPDIDGYETARRMRDARSAWIPIIFLSGNREDQDLSRAITAGGDDYLLKPCSEVVLAAKIRSMERLQQMRSDLLETTQKLHAVNMELEHQTRQDTLTGIANRRHLESHLGAEFRRAARTGTPIAVLLCDVDYFKLYNDRYGHQAGDDCLRQVAQFLAGQARRPTDLAARYGGEEFSVVLPDTPLAGARTIAKKICGGIAALRIPHQDAKGVSFVTISVGGVCGVPARDASVEQFLEAADKALYHAMELGRNRVMITQLGEGTRQPPAAKRPPPPRASAKKPKAPPPARKKKSAKSKGKAARRG